MRKENHKTQAVARLTPVASAVALALLCAAVPALAQVAAAPAGDARMVYRTRDGVGRLGRYDLGMFRTHCGPLYVNPGIGWFPVPIRFNCRPEITVFEF